MFTTIAKAVSVAALLIAPSFAFAAASATIGAINPAGGTAGAGTRITFSMITSGFTNPTYYVTDSFPGGATSINIDGQGNFSWTPNNDDIGTHVINVLVSDTQGNTASASYSFQVVAPQIMPSTPTSASVQYGSTISFTLTYTGFTNPVIAVEDAFFNSSVSSSNLQGATFTWTPQKKDVGTHKLTISARDAGGRFHSTTQNIIVLGVPSVTVTDLTPGTTVGAGQDFSFIATTTELMSPSVGVQDLFYGSGTSTFAWDGKKLTWKPVYNDVGIHQFLITAAESSGRTATTELRVSVVPYSVAVPTPAATTPSATGSASGTASNSSSASGTSATASSYVFKTYLALGMSGTAVTELQKKLVILGFLKVEPTGYFGTLTKKAVQDLQKANNLEQVGFVGPGTRAVLNK